MYLYLLRRNDGFSYEVGFTKHVNKEALEGKAGNHVIVCRSSDRVWNGETVVGEIRDNHGARIEYKGRLQHYFKEKTLEQVRPKPV